MVNGIVRLGGDSEHPGYALCGKRFKVKDDMLKDLKYNKTYPLMAKNKVYNSETRELLELSPEELALYIEKLPVPKRHWIQLIENESIINLIKKIVPRVEYIL